MTITQCVEPQPTRQSLVSRLIAGAAATARSVAVVARVTVGVLLVVASVGRVVGADAAADAAPAPPAVVADASLDNAVAYLRTQQQADGSFGQPQPHLQAGLVMLAILARSATPSEADVTLLENGTRYLLATSSSTGDLSDSSFETESHSIALLAMIASHEYLRDATLRQDSAERIDRGFKQLSRWQDRSTSSSSRGGWRMEGSKGRVNDRRATAWALVACLAARQYGIEVPDATFDRAQHFMIGAFKAEASVADQVGGFSVDSEGLTVEMMSAMGGWMLACLDGTAEQRRLNQTWLAIRAPTWSGPNWFYSNFFRIRILKRGNNERLYDETRQRLQAQIRDHQAANGSVGLPPGNAQNTVAMGPVFSTAMAVLILAADDSRLPFDELYAPANRLPATAPTLVPVPVAAPATAPAAAPTPTP